MAGGHGDADQALPMASAAAMRSLTIHTGPHLSEPAQFWSRAWDELGGQPVQRALCPAGTRVRWAASATGGRGHRRTLVTAQQQAERDATRALTALRALSQDLQAATRRAEPPERVHALRGQLADVLVRVQALHNSALAPPD